MTMFYNEDEVLQYTRGAAIMHPRIEPYAQFLRSWVEIVNDNSDGWAHWVGGWRAASKLAGLIKDAAYGTCATDSELRKACGIITGCATRNGLPQPTLAPVAAPERTDLTLGEMQMLGEALDLLTANCDAYVAAWTESDPTGAELARRKRDRVKLLKARLPAVYTALKYPA